VQPSRHPAMEGTSVNRPQLLVGGTLVLLGALFLLDELEVLSAAAVIGSWWPVIIVAIGAQRIVSRPPDLLGGGVTAAIGLVLLGVTTDRVDGSVLALVWPLGLIAVGIYLVAARARANVAPHEMDSVSTFVLFSGRELAPVSRQFAGGSIVAIFGGVELDLRGCLPAEGAHLDVTAAFGGCEIHVPPGWRIRMRGPAIFGGADNAAQGQDLGPDAPTLDVRVLALFGGVEVKVVPLPVMPAG
jgi:hypothetical protein